MMVRYFLIGMTRLYGWLVMMLALSGTAMAQAVSVPNPQFELGDNTLAGWRLSSGDGQWLDTCEKRKRVLAVSGTGKGTNHWRSTILEFAPSTTYRISFDARNLDGKGGTPVTGPPFCNRDLGKLPDIWTTFSSVFVTPQELSPENSYVRFGQWHVDGTIAFDNVRIDQVQPVYKQVGDLFLGEGELLDSDQYVCLAPFRSLSRNHSRSLHSHHCSFNSNRWVFTSEDWVVYRHRVGTLIHTQATIEADITWYSGGRLVLEVSRDGATWRTLGIRGKLGVLVGSVPEEMLPASEIWVRLRAESKKKLGPNSGHGSFQVSSYSYRAAVTGAKVEGSGNTRFPVISQSDPDLDVTIEKIGEGIPGGRNSILLKVTDPNDRGMKIQPRVVLFSQGKTVSFSGRSQVLKQGTNSVSCSYDVPGPGDWQMEFDLGDEAGFSLSIDLTVPSFYDMSYGLQLPGASEMGLWWASSGWKIPRSRPRPARVGEAIILRTAGNEAEAAQLVIRPEKPLSEFRVHVEALAGPGANAIPPDSIDVLRVGYVPVTQPTDTTGVVAAWPDPLLPLDQSIDLEAGINHPFWIRVKPPRGLPAGSYKGYIHLTADGLAEDILLEVDLYGFDLPERMTCTTAFGFNPSTVWHYQKISDSNQRREVLEKYWQSFSEHHISPYNPAPMDSFTVTWPGASEWKGGVRSSKEQHSGAFSLMLHDADPNANINSVFDKLIAIPAGGLRLRLWYKTATPGHKLLVSLNHHDRSGQWMSGRNTDISVTGTGKWQFLEKTMSRFPSNAESVTLRLWAAPYRDDGSTMGTVWYDDVSVQDAATGDKLVTGGDFEPIELTRFQPVFDWRAWDTTMSRAVDTYHFNSFLVPIQGIGGGTFQSRREPSLLGYGDGTPEYTTAFAAYCRAVQEHLCAKGWLDEAFVYWFDEPEPKDYEFVMNGFRKLAVSAPGIRRMLTEQVEEDLTGGPNLWCPASHNYDHTKAEERRLAGEHFWWYVCCVPKAPYCTLFIDHPATELRVLLWQTWKRGIEGILVWQTNHWTSPVAYPDPAHPQNPYVDPMSWVSYGNVQPGVRKPWGNGDGRFIYPPEAAADGQQSQTILDGPVDSIRWEMLRDGIEDYEYLAMLRDLLADRGKSLALTKRAQFEALLEVPDAISSSMTSFTTDPAPLEQHRNVVAEAIQELLR